MRRFTPLRGEVHSINKGGSRHSEGRFTPLGDETKGAKKICHVYTPYVPAAVWGL